MHIARKNRNVLSEGLKTENPAGDYGRILQTPYRPDDGIDACLLQTILIAGSFIRIIHIMSFAFSHDNHVVLKTAFFIPFSLVPCGSGTASERRPYARER